MNRTVVGRVLIYAYHTHTRLTALCPGLPGWAGTRKVKPIWILLKQETVSGSEIRRAICKSAPCSRQITTPAPHRSVFYRPDALPAAQPTASKHYAASMHIRSLIMKLSPSPKSTTPRARKHRAESGTLITGSQKKSVKKTASSAVAALQGASDPPTKNLAFQQPPTPTIYVCMHVCVL